ncbi:hypothetical protein ARMGADRAFT_1085423 [Armillaria gallica]|uniref:Uncharacterized protein n=1 Tax=Armillaria gallica TaxID=47427 RepID=A0A2H3D1Y4_ARMGA|nr:hypothetical protein ARMGADRAFT_1085423 [Armillaria gallica]
MAEAIGIVSSITALIKVTVTVIKYDKDVKHGPEECAELQGVKAHLEVCAPLKSLEDASPAWMVHYLKWLFTKHSIEEVLKRIGCIQSLIIVAGEPDHLKPSLAIQTPTYLEKRLADVEDTIRGTLENTNVSSATKNQCEERKLRTSLDRWQSKMRCNRLQVFCHRQKTELAPPFFQILYVSIHVL